MEVKKSKEKGRGSSHTVDTDEEFKSAIDARTLEHLQELKNIQAANPLKNQEDVKNYEDLSKVFAAKKTLQVLVRRPTSSSSSTAKRLTGKPSKVVKKASRRKLKKGFGGSSNNKGSLSWHNSTLKPSQTVLGGSDEFFSLEKPKGKILPPVPSIYGHVGAKVDTGLYGRSKLHYTPQGAPVIIPRSKPPLTIPATTPKLRFPFRDDDVMSRAERIKEVTDRLYPGTKREANDVEDDTPVNEFLKKSKFLKYRAMNLVYSSDFLGIKKELKEIQKHPLFKEDLSLRPQPHPHQRRPTIQQNIVDGEKRVGKPPATPKEDDSQVKVNQLQAKSEKIMNSLKHASKIRPTNNFNIIGNPYLRKASRMKPEKLLPLHIPGPKYDNIYIKPYSGSETDDENDPAGIKRKIGSR